MANYKNLFMRHMDSEGIRYDDINETTVKVTYKGDNLKSIPVYVFFDEDGEPMVELKCWDIENFSDKEAKALIACNDLNKKYRWVKFFLDKDSDIIVSIDAYIDDVTCGQECLSLVRRVVNITDEAYPVFIRAKYGL